MNNPIKIIHKFKNNNRRVQYIQYIFIGSLVDDNVYNLLKSIKNKNFYETLEFLNKSKLKILEDYYGDKWYTFFFNTKHIKAQKDIILKSSAKRNNISSKLGKEWISKHLEISIEKQKQYSFASNYYDYLITRNKIKTKTKKKEMDFTTYNQIGGNDDENLIKEDNIDEKLEEEDDEEPTINTVEDLDDEVIEDFDLEELTKLYSMQDVETDKNIKDTAKLISEATKDKSWLKEAKESEIEFNNKLDNITYDTNLEDVYEKEYIMEQYIFMDDMVKTLREKIAVSIGISDKFSNVKLLPEYMYFWTEYNLNNTTDYVMLGQKWIRRNELLKIDIKPNENLSVYENLRDNLKYLRDSFGIKIKREDDEALILRDYEDYMTNNEIYMTDLLNDLGINYSSSADKKKNLYEVYVNIYYPYITFERFEDILELLNNVNDKEENRNESLYNNLINDVKLEKEIYTIVEETKLEKDKYEKFFNENYILQTIIHLNLYNPKNKTGTLSEEKFNLYKIFDNFIVNKDYPFIQYQTPDSQITYKYYTKTKVIENNNILMKWFDTAPYGISFKIRVTDDKYISINFNETGRIEYKITWIEDDKAVIDDIKESYKYVNDLLLKINNENKKIKIILPTEEQFKYAFINTIQKFILPKTYKINHNDLSDFSRFFYPYVSLVIEPKKRKAGIQGNESSKYGTYLRYKRVSNYENKTRMHLRILYFLRNFDISDKDLVDEISKQFNITLEDAAKELDSVKGKYSKILEKVKKSKKLKGMPKSKPPGIGIDIQGRNRENYKIRITGARSKDQLTEILSFIKVLIYLYSETYLEKKGKYQKIKDKLLKLNKIAKRRNKVREIVDYDTDKVKVSDITSLDKKRLGFKPEEGMNQWTRSCQNSGEDDKRRPIIVSGDNINQLIKRGYKFNSKTNFYEKEVMINNKKISVRAVKLVNDDGKVNYFTCDPQENKKHMFIGFLSKSSNPNELCMPCCFKKDQMTSSNTVKKNYYMKCIGNKKADENLETEVIKEIKDKIYVLQETNKVQEGRFIFLSKYLNYFFNKVWKNDYKIKNHYLTESNSGYFLKYTVKDNYFFFLSAIANIYNKSIDELKEICINTLKEDKDDRIFTYLNNGDLRAMFNTREELINHIKNSNYLEYDILGELLAIPGILSDLGIFYFILEKKVKVIKKQLEKDIFKENYYIKCLNNENNYTMDDNRDYVILLKEGKYYFPIYRVMKKSTDKLLTLQKKYTLTNESTKNIMNELVLYYSKSCKSDMIRNLYTTSTIYAKDIINLLNKNNIKIKGQYINDRNKVKIILLDNGLYLPVNSSGSNYNYPIYNISNIKSYLSLDNTIKLLKDVEKKIQLNYIPEIIYYDSFYTKNNKSEYNVTSILLKNKTIIPIKPEKMNAAQFKKYGLSHEFLSLEEIIDKVIINNEVANDDRDKRVRENLYRNEGYNLFRLELSYFLSQKNDIRNKIISTVRNTNIKNKDKRKELTDILLKYINTKTENKVSNNNKDSIATVVKNLPILNDYVVSNIRNYCVIHRNKDSCENSKHCLFINNKCQFQIYTDDLYIYINKVIEEMILDRIKFKELVQEDNFYVSDIVDYTQYSNRPDQKIIKTSNFNIKKIMTELFGENNMPKLGRRNKIKQNEEFVELIELGKQLIQEIKNNDNSIIRAYVNSFYWLNNPLYDIESRNLGYSSELQSNITNLFKAYMIDYIQNNIYNAEFAKDIEKYFTKKDFEQTNFFLSAINKFRKRIVNTDGILELTLLSYMFKYPIVVYDNYNIIKYIFNNGPVKVNEKTIDKYSNIKDCIFLKFDFEEGNKIPFKIYSIYYIN